MNEFGIVKHLEVELHQSATRLDAERVSALLHKSFVECGRSGRVCRRTEILEALTKEKPGNTVWSQDFAGEEVSDGVILLTYLSAHIDSDGALFRHTFRSSLWQRTPHGWQMRFHQGTPISAFVQQAIYEGV